VIRYVCFRVRPSKTVGSTIGSSDVIYVFIILSPVPESALRRTRVYISSHRVEPMAEVSNDANRRRSTQFER